MPDDITDVVKYDRDKLTAHELQPVTEIDGHMICVNRYGRFTAKVGPVEVHEDTLFAAKEKVHRTHLSQVRRAKKKVLAVPAFIYATDGHTNPICFEDVFFRGVHARTGAIMWSLPDGSKGSAEKVWVFARDGAEVERVKVLASRMKAGRDKMRTAEASLRKILQAQKDLMYAARSGWGQRPLIRNNFERANESADQIVENVLKPKEEDQ